MTALKFFLGIWLTVVFTVALVFPMVQNPQSWYEFPIIPGLEDKARILFFHVPMAWVTVVAFMVAMVYGIKYLAKRNLDDDSKSVASAGLGLLFCVLATTTGSLWAKFSWGSFWNWDPRETSIFILLLVYGAYFALRSALETEEKRATLSAVYSIIAGVTVPFFIFIMPRLVASLHPDPIVNNRGKIDMNGTMLVIFLSSLAGFTAFYVWLWNLKVRSLRLESKLQTHGE
ncbi:MAG: cytochrome c biogenesis protein CcsA [Ignavibacteriae bacterium]|nr:cytochrome c biogenesis protein CcsA [Ignavibacteriota bacterium]